MSRLRAYCGGNPHRGNPLLPILCSTRSGESGAGSVGIDCKILKGLGYEIFYVEVTDETGDLVGRAGGRGPADWAGRGCAGIRQFPGSHDSDARRRTAADRAADAEGCQGAAAVSDRSVTVRGA